MDFSAYIMESYAIPQIVTEREKDRIEEMKLIQFLSTLSEQVKQRVSLQDISSPIALVSKVSSMKEDGQAEFLLMFFCSPGFFRKLVQYNGGEDKKLFRSFYTFQEKARTVIKAYREFVTQLEVYLCYVERGGKQLNRKNDDIITDNPDMDETALDSLLRSLNHCFSAYYHQLLAKEIFDESAKVKMPEVDKELLRLCCRKEWLRPLAHVLLIRRAQYCLMNIRTKQSYNKLLSHDSRPYTTANNEKELSFDKITYQYCLAIRQTFERWLETYSTEKNIAGHIRRYMHKKYRAECEKPLLLNPGNSDFYKVMQSEKVINLTMEFNRTAWDVDQYAGGFFSIPFGRFEKIAWRLSHIFNLSYDEYVTLRNYLPAYLLRRGNKYKLPKKDATPEEQQSFQEILKSLSSAVSPKSYYSLTDAEYKKAEKKFSSDVSDLASKGFLNSWKHPDTPRKRNNPYGKNDKPSGIWEFTKKYVKLYDLTAIGLTVSNSIHLPFSETLLKNEFPGMVSKRIQKVLHRHMPNKRKEILGETPFDKEWMKEISVDRKYKLLRNTLIDLISKKLSSTSFLISFQSANYEQMARERNKLFSDLDAELARMRKNDTNNEGENAALAYGLLHQCSEDEKKYIFLYAYQQAANNHLNKMCREIMSTLFDQAYQEAHSFVATAVSESEDDDSSST